MGEFGVGQSVAREEDPYLVRGKGRYVDDVVLSGQLRGYVLRSPHGHAQIVSIDPSAAKAMPGVALILTAHDPEIAALGLQKPKQARKRKDGQPAFVSLHPQLAKDRVHYIGEPVAFVVAETIAQAKDAAEAISVEYETLPAVGTLAQAAEPGAPAIWVECPDNCAWTHTVGDKAATQAAIENAAHVITHRMVINRLTTNAMEPRGCVADYDARDDRTTLTMTSQGPHVQRRTIATEILKIPETKLRVISDNVGGGFGMKGGTYAEYPLCCVAAKMLGRPVKWISERGEGFLSDEHCRDNITDAELALDKNGKILALRIKTLANIGAYNAQERVAGPVTNNIGVLSGTYVIPASHVEVNAVMTNTMLTGPYRGAGRPEAAYVVETMMDLAARQLKLDYAEIRRRNLIPSAAMPYKTALVYTYDCGDFPKNLEDCVVLADYAGFAKRKAESAKHGKLRGVGFASTVEASNAGLIEHAEIRFDASGTLTVFVGAHDHGQGHQTTFRQIIVSKLGVSVEKIAFKFGDTDAIMAGTGTFGSRSTISAGSAMLMAADKLITKGIKIAAHMLEAGEHDIAFANGKFTVTGTDKAVDLFAVAQSAFMPAKLPKGVEAGFFETGTFDGGERTYPNGCHITEVEIDEATGHAELVRYTAVDDVGHMINPMLVEGQLHGGIAMGVGQALMENIVYDADGQLVSGSFMDYCMPRAGNFPDIRLGENEVPTKTNVLGVKGAGESGTVGALASVMNAVNDALASVGAGYMQMPCTPEKLWLAIENARMEMREAAE